MEDKKPVSSDKWTEALYETLKLNNAYDKDYDTFYNDFYAPGIKGYTYRKDVYDDMTSHGLDLGATYEDFASKIGLHAIDPQTQQTPMGADSISKDMTPVEVTPTKKPEAKKEEKSEVSAESVSENQHPIDTLQDFNPNVSRMRNAGTDYYLQAAEEISNNAYSKSLEELANQAAKDLKKKAYQKPKEDSYVRLNQTARYIPIRSLPKDADLDSVFEAALTFENQVCGGAKEYTFAPLGGDIQERYEKWKALRGHGSSYTQETASMSPNAVYLQAINLQALGKERPAWISELRWNEALNYDKNKLNKITAELEQEDQKRRLKRSDGAYPDDVSLNGMYHANYTALMASDIYNNGTNKTIFVLFQDGRIRPLQAPDPSILRGGVEAQRELFRRQYEKMTFGEEGKDDTDPYEKNRVVGNFLQNGEVFHIIYFPYMIEQRRLDDVQELIKIRLGGKFNEEGVLLNPDDRLQIVPVVVKNGESEEDAIAKAKVELDNEISIKLPYKETYLQQQIAQAREALKKEQERLKQFGDHDYIKESYMAAAINPRSLAIKLMANTEEGAKISDEVALARGNIRKLEESIKKYTQALEALRTGDKVGAWGGFLEGISDLDNWTFGLYNLRENLVAVKAHEMGMGQEAKNRLGLARSLSQESMSAFHRYGEGRFYGPAFGAGYSTPFTLGAIATYGAGNVAARGIIRGGSRMAAKYGTNWLFDTTIRATTRLAAINAAGVIDSSFQMPRIISDAAIEKMGLMNYTFDENQRIVVTGTQQEKSWGHSLLHSGLNTLVQNVSERVGTYVLEPVAKAFGIGKISLRSFGEALPYNKTIHMIQNGAFAKAMSKVYGTFEKGGYDGFVNEVLEEYIANPMTATFDENYTFADIFNYRQNLDTALSVWASSFVMLGLASTASSVKYYRTLRSVNSAYDKAEANARRLFGNENWDKIQNTILRLEGDPLVNAIYAGVCQNKSLSDEQKKAFLNYVRAQKAQAVFNNTVSEKYSFSLTGEELEEMNAMTVRAYAEGRNMQTPQEYAQAQQAFADTREMAVSALGVAGDIDAYLDTLGETPAEQLKKGVEAAKEKGLDEKTANAALSAYLNAREQQKGAMDGITSDESIRRQHADNVIRQITFENEADSEGGSGKVILVNVKGREKPVFLVRGRYENGSITGEMVVVSEGNGVIEMIPASEVEGFVEESDAMTERQREYDKIDAENKEQQRLINLNMDTPLAGQGGILMDEEGHRRQVGIKCVFNDEQGNPASVLVVDQNNNDYLIPIDVFREQRGRGRKFEAIEPYLDETDEEYHAEEGPMNEEYNLANKEQEGVSEEDAQGAAEGVTPQPTTDTTEKPTKPEVKYDYHVKIKDGSGNAVSGRVTNLSADGVEIEFDAPYNGKMVDRIPLADFDNGVSEIADANGNVLWNETEAVGDTEVAPQVDATPTQAGQEDAEKPAIAQAEQEHKPTALERIPRSENGEPLFEQAENPEVAWDALVEFSDGNAATAKEIADAMTEEKRKALEKARKLKLKGKTPAEMLASKQANAAELAKAESEYNHWQRMANVEQNRQNAIRAQQEAEARQRATERAEAEKAEREAREEAERREREALEGIPEWHMDTPENARKRGARRYGGQIFTRQEPVNGVVGKEVEVKFSQKDLPKGHVIVMEAEQLQPSHIQGKRNPMFFIEEAQPKNRAEDVSQTAARNIAENIRPQEITSSTTAYTGAPTINTRGEVIQGNNRSDALRYLWQNNLPKQQQAYKQYLLDQAEQLGLDSNAINAMQHPVLVNQLDVDDAEAIRLGQMTAQDTESGGVERIKPKNVAQKLGDNMRTFANRLLSSSDNDATFGQLVDRNGEDVLNWMNQIGAISNTQYQSAFDSKGKLTPEAKNDLQKVLYQAVFKGGSQQLEEMFDRLPAKAQRAILSTAFRDMDSPFAGKMLSEIQSSIIAYNALMQDEGFASAKNMEEVLRAIEIFKHQTALDDRFEQYMPADNFSNFALHLAGLYKASDMSQTTIASYFNEMYDLAQGKKAATLFEEADTTEYPLAEVIKKVLGIDYKPAKNGNNNVANGGADVALRNQESQGRQPRSNKPSASGEQNQTGAESSERGEGVGVSDNEQGKQVDIEGNAPRKGDLAEAQENGPKNSTQAAVKSASAEVETSPTEAQKKAGNYKMGHVKVGAFDVTIENPKGSERSGTDANGKKWSVKMKNTYGYIRGTEGVDGDHIDVFLAEDMDKWDGKYVFVVDQYNPDGTFDEHKVMLGFNSMEEARSAYLSNYEKGWENGRRIVVARIKTDDFQKWVDSSHRKTKPFAHYVIAGAADVSDNEKKPSASKKGKPHVSKENEVKRTVEHFPMETPEEAAAFDKRVPEMKDSELLAYMQEDGKGDINSAYHMNIYDEYDYRHTDEQTEAYNTYIQQLHDSNTTLEQAEEMLGNILGDVERFATDERSQLIGQSDALQDYITELERQKEDKRAEAENSAENTDANHVEEADVEENKSAEPVEADKSKQYGEYQEVYDNFVSDVENRGMIPDLKAIKNKIRDTKRRLTVLKNGAATSIQSDEDLKRFETAEKKLTDLLHVYEAMRDYTEARIKKAEAAAQRKPWSEKNAQERMDEASKNPLTEEEIQNAPTDEVNKANALDYLSGNHGLIQSISYLKVYEDVRNPNGSAASDSGTKDKTQLAGRSNSASEGRDTGGKSGGTVGRVDNGGSRENVSEQSDGGKSGERSTRDNAGEGSNTGISTEEQPVGRRDANSGKPRRGGTSGRTRSDGGRSGRGESGNPATENGTRRAASESVKEESADDFLNQALGEFKDVLDDFIKAGRGELSISLVGLNSKQMEILPRLIQVGAKVGYAYIRKGVHGFTEWANHVKEAIGKYLRDANLSDDEIDAFIKEMWKSKIPFDGQIHTLEEWASIYSKKDLRNKVRTTIEEKREAQRQAESISVKTGDINNIRETLPFLLPQQQEDVLRAETQFFDETHQDREHANGKGYMFTNGTGTGKTYTGLGIVKRFVKQGKKRILILTPSQPKVRDWINDGKNLGLEIKSLDDWAKERGTTATTEAGEGTIITTYANFRQNEELLNGTFDLIVYDESHRLMENKNAANTIGTNQHHMIANRDILQATVRLRKINPIYQKLNKVHEEFMAKRENLVSQGLIPYSFNVDNWNEEDAERFPDLAKLRKRYLELRDVIVKEVDPQIEEQAKKDAAHTKVVFLSATPFNTRENIDYAQGYIFSYPDKEQARGYSVASPQTIFFEEHFGAAYKWRYGRLEHSERNAEAIAQQEREFSDWLQHTLCTMSGRIIDSEYDYSRDFPVVSVEHAEEINNAAEEILRDKYFNMAYHKVFGNYNYAGALFETLKVATLIPRIKQHLEAGRKVVIFHRRVESKTPLIPPFAAMLSACHAIIDEMKMKNMPKEEIDAARHRLEELKEKWRGLLKWESMLDYSMPREQIAKAFGADNVLYFSGQESTKVKNQAVDSFNNDESGKNIIVIQEASGKEGISLHDTTGKHQRVLITLALPQSPITALQIEGRIYRIGNRSNAIFEYPLLGLNSEIILFGQKFNGQIGTTENLALGSQARNLRESFARSVEESGKDVPIEEQGFGGKEADAAERDETSPFDRAVLDYYGNQKLKGKRDSREGVDYYPTPEPLGFKMVEWGNLNDGETALEPSAGHGAIARYVPSANPLTAIEPSQNLFAKLQLKAGGSGRKFVNTIFEDYNVVNKHDVIFMNPPFGTGGRLAVDHVAKAFTHLTEGGRIVAIIPRGSTDKKFDKWIDEQENAVVTGEIMLPDITFQQAGTSVMARVLVIDKVTNQSLRSEAENKYRSIDLSRRKYDKIEDFFEDIRDIQMPSRTIDEKARMLKRAAPALRDIKELKGVVDVQAQEDGIDIRTKGSAMGFYLDLTVSDFSLQQQLRTKYQRYAQEIEWNERRHNEKAVEIYKAYNDLVCRLLGKTAEEVESDITREKMGLEQPHEEQGVAINVAPQAEESPSSEQNESTTESSPYHYELKHHTKTGAEMFMAMPNEKSGLSSEEYSSMLAKAKKHGGYWNRFMKGFAFPSEKSAKDFLAETGNTEPQADERYQKAGTPLTPNSAEVALRDAIADLMRKSGLDVIDHEEGQQVLDIANGRGTRLSVKQKRALETVTIADESTNNATAISSADGAKIQKNLESLAEGYSNHSNKSKGFITDLSQSLNLEQHEASHYGTFVTENGKTVTIRVSNHNARVSNFDRNGEIDGISIVISSHGNKGLNNDGNAHIVEFFYSKQSLERSEGKPLADIIRSVSTALKNGEFKDNTGLAQRQEVNEQTIREHRVYHGSGVRFFRTSNGEAYGFTVGGKIYIDPRIATAETPIHEYAHLWAIAMREGNPTEWKNIVGLMKGTSVWAEVQKLYPELKSDDDIADEVLATFSGRRGAERLRAEQQKIMQSDGSVFEKAAAVGALSRVKQALSKFWKGVADFLGIHYTSAEEVADRVMKDLLEGVDPRKFGVSGVLRESIRLPKTEYAKVAHAIATNKGFKKAGMNEVFTDNNYYIYTAKKNGDFTVRFGLPIEGNEDVINELSKGVEDGTIRNTRSLYSVIERERSKQNENNYNYVNAEGRQKSTGAIGNLALRQQADSTGSDGYLGEEIPGRTPAGNSDRGTGRETGRIDDNLYRQGEATPHVSTSSESKTQAAQKATENLNLGGRVVVHESAERLEGKEATAKGWYDTKTGQIHVVLSNNADAADVTQTILHEAVAHHGLRELFGHNVMDAFLDSVLAAASQEVKDAINELRRGNGWNFRTATEEYLAGLAERTDFERMTAEERGLFATIRRLFNRALEFLGLKNHELSDRELAYILWCSYQNLKAGEKGRYVAEAERIAMRYKLKAGKNAMTDTEKREHSVLLRGELNNLQEILAKDTYERLVTSGSHLERTAWVDMLSPLQDLQHAIEKNGGFKLGDFENPYNAYITMSSRNYAQMDIYKRTLYADMIEAIHALGSETGRSYEEIKTYVMGKHGMERQKYMAGKAAEEAYNRYKSMHPFGQKTLDDFIDEYEEKSFAGLTELFGTQSVSDAMNEAQKYVEEVEAEAGSLADSLWDSIRAATKSSLQRAYEAGLISKETYDNVSSMYQYYIPLRGFDETTSDEVYEYFGDQTINGGTGSFMRKAKGRKSVADDPFAVIGNMAEMAIMQSNRNLMKQQLLNLALNHPSDLISVSDLYVKFDEDYDNGDGTRGAWVPVAVPDTSGMTTEEANQVMLDFQDDMEEKVKDEPDTYALAHQKPHIPYRVLGRNMNEHQVMVKRGGKTYILTINGNPRAAQAINGLLNPDATENPGAIALKAMTNWIARMATARNVEFAISNAMRDLEFSTTLIPKEGTEYYGRYVKNYLTCVKNIGRLVNRLNGNTLDMSNPLEKAFYDFIYNGGETGYTFMKGVERYKGEITKALSELRAKEGKSKIERLSNKVVYGHHYVINDAWNIYMKGAEYLSRCTEDWVRFAVFLTSRQMGRSMEQSIMDAKEVTINFNRKGAGSKSAGKWDVSNFFSMNNLHFLSAYAASAFKNFYAFSNASIQGLDKNVRLHLNHTAGMLMWDGAAVALGMLSAMCIPLMLSAIGGDPDDYWDMPDSMRRMGIMLPLGKDGRFLTLPMSIEHRAAYGIGELLGTVVCGSENLPASEITFQAFEQLSQILPLDLTEGNGSMLSLVPTAVRPEVEIAFNKNWLGMPIYKEPFNKNTPAFRNVYQSTNPNYIAMSKWLNEVQGGGDYERAGVQVNPAMVQHLVESYTGGAGKFVSRTSGVIAKIIQGEQIRSNEIPFYRTLVKSVDDRTHNRAARERFQREYDKGQKLIYKIDNYQKESARGNSQYVKELNEFAKSKDFMSYMLWKSYNSVKSQFGNARSYIGDDKDKRAALDHAQMLVQKMMTECARAVEDSKTQEEADEKIGRIQSEYTPQIKETLRKVED